MYIFSVRKLKNIKYENVRRGETEISHPEKETPINR
jgi:hypothetical protein